MHRTAVLIPCYNEEATIRTVVEDFRAQLPDADIYVYDNNSTDRSVEEARRAGAKVVHEKRQGKGNVVRSMFHDIDADIYVMVDGDGTYPADKVHELISPVAAGEADMVVGTRLHTSSVSEFKPLNRLGNRIFRFLLNSIFRVNLTDLLSGYRAFNRRIVNMPLLSRGFDIETELTLKTIEYNYRIAEVPVNLSPRPEGSSSKIRMISDGVLIFNTIFSLFRDYKPLTAFGALGVIIVLLSLIPGSAVISTYLSGSEEVNIPLSIASLGLFISGIFVVFIGLVLHTISRRFQEIDSLLQNMISKGSSGPDNRT